MVHYFCFRLFVYTDSTTKSTQPSRLSVGRHVEYQEKPSHKQANVALVWQCELVSSWRLRERKSRRSMGLVIREELWFIFHCRCYVAFPSFS